MLVESDVAEPYTWQSLADLPVLTNRQLYLLEIKGVPAMVTPDHSVMSITVMAYQRAGQNVRIQVVLNDPTEDELTEAGFDL